MDCMFATMAAINSILTGTSLNAAEFNLLSADYNKTVSHPGDLV